MGTSHRQLYVFRSEEHRSFSLDSDGVTSASIGSAYGTDIETCEPGTRLDILAQIREWAKAAPSTKQIFWIKDGAGTHCGIILRSTEPEQTGTGSSLPVWKSSTDDWVSLVENSRPSPSPVPVQKTGTGSKRPLGTLVQYNPGPVFRAGSGLAHRIDSQFQFRPIWSSQLNVFRGFQGQYMIQAKGKHERARIST